MSETAIQAIERSCREAEVSYQGHSEHGTGLML